MHVWHDVTFSELMFPVTWMLISVASPTTMLLPSIIMLPFTPLLTMTLLPVYVILLDQYLPDSSGLKDSVSAIKCVTETPILVM